MGHGLTPPPPVGHARSLWIVSTGAGVLSFLIALIAFLKSFAHYPPASRFVEALYSSAELLLLHFAYSEVNDLVQGRVWLGNAFLAARVLAVIAVGTTVVALLYHFFSNEVKRQVRSGLGRHTVVCGLTPLGEQLVHQFCTSTDPQPSNRHKVVVITEQPMDSVAVRSAVESGVAVVQGDPVDPHALSKARAWKAKHIFAALDEDDRNVGIAVHCVTLAHEKSAGKGAGQIIATHIADPDLRVSLRHRFPYRADDIAPHVRMFNVFENCVRLLLLNHGLDYVHITEKDKRAVQVVIVGFGGMGEAVLIRAAMISHYANGKRLRARVIDREADKKKRMFLARHPSFEKVCDVEFLQLEVEDPRTRHRITQWCDDLANDQISTLVIALDNDSRGLSLALALADHVHDGIPIRVRLKDQSGFAPLLTGRSKALTNRLTSFGSTREGCASENWVNFDLDAMARALHEDYRNGMLRGYPSHENDPDSRFWKEHPNLRVWEEIDEDLIDSNRQAADHIPVKLRALGYHHVKKSSRDPGELISQFKQEDVELLAKMEHQRWVAERYLAGWVLGEKDYTNLSSPHLVAWDALEPKEVQEIDRNFVRVLPRVLEKANYEIRR